MTATQAYQFNEALGYWTTTDGQPICAVIYEPSDFEPLEDFLAWEDEEDGGQLPVGADRAALVGAALVEAERLLPNLAYELIRDCIRDTLREKLHKLHRTPKA